MYLRTEELKFMWHASRTIQTGKTRMLFTVQWRGRLHCAKHCTFKACKRHGSEILCVV